jgi:cystathionine beta-lyase/cystathionine gamma-synthase
MHSTTKYIGGHSDVVGGFVATNREDVWTRLKFCQNAVGATPGPFDCWLTLRGVKTLFARMRAHEENARAIAERLARDPRVLEVFYPGLPSHPGHEVHKSQASGFGGIISFRVRGGIEKARQVCAATRIFFLAESLGGVESLIEHPGIMTHASVPAENRARLGIADDLIRISVGIENVEDLVEDLDRALSR